MGSDRLTQSRKHKGTGSNEQETKISPSRVKRQKRGPGTGCAVSVSSLCG